MYARRSVLLAAAFAALLVVIGVSATAVWWNARTAQEMSNELHNAHMRVDAALASIRSDIYLTGILTRDYLLDTDSDEIPDYTEQFRSIQRDTERNFDILKGSPQVEEHRVALAGLHREIQLQYWNPTIEALGWTPAEKEANREILLTKLVTRRREVVNLSEEVERLITQNFSQERERATRAGQDLRTSFGWITVVALLLGAAISGAAWLRMTRLEQQSQAAETELRRLSGQIRTAQEQERKNLSRELHDEVGQLPEAVVSQWLASDDPPDAIFAGNSRMTAGTLNAIKNAGMVIPNDIGVAGFDETVWMQHVGPGITTIGQPTYEIGRTAAELLLQRIEESDRSAREVILHGYLIERGSTQKHRRIL
jgi:CHASE3 domain sensor protein